MVTILNDYTYFSAFGYLGNLWTMSVISSILHANYELLRSATYGNVIIEKNICEGRRVDVKCSLKWRRFFVYMLRWKINPILMENSRNKACSSRVWNLQRSRMDKSISKRQGKQLMISYIDLYIYDLILSKASNSMYMWLSTICYRSNCWRSLTHPTIQWSSMVSQL